MAEGAPKVFPGPEVRRRCSPPWRCAEGVRRPGVPKELPGPEVPIAPKVQGAPKEADVEDNG